MGPVLAAETVQPSSVLMHMVDTCHDAIDKTCRARTPALPMNLAMSALDIGACGVQGRQVV